MSLLEDKVRSDGVSKISSATSFLLISSEFPPGPGGIGQHAYCLASAMSQRGLKVHVSTGADYVEEDEIRDFDASLNGNLAVYRYSRSRVFGYVRRISQAWKILRKSSIDVIVVSGKFSLWTGAFLKLIGIKRPILAILHGSEVNQRKSLHRKLTHWALKSADHLVPVSKFTLSLIPTEIRDRCPFTVIPNGIRIRERDDINVAEMPTFTMKGEPILLTVGNVTRRKGQHRVIRALPRILEEYPDACYHIIGLPTECSEFKRLAAELDVADHVVFHGFLRGRNEVRKAYMTADVFLLLSQNQPDGDVEGFGIVVLEANLFGLPVIGAKGCGIEDAIRNGQNGYLVNGDVPEDICERLRNILARREELIDSSKEWAERHDWDNIVRRYEEVFQKLL